MANDLEKLKASLWKQFEIAARVGESLDKGTAEVRASNRQAAGTLALAIVAAEREQREREQDKKTFQLVGK